MSDCKVNAALRPRIWRSVAGRPGLHGHSLRLYNTVSFSIPRPIPFPSQLTASRLVSLLWSRNDFCSGLGGPALLTLPSSLNVAILSSCGRCPGPAISFSATALMLALMLWPGVGEPGLLEIPPMPLRVGIWLLWPSEDRISRVAGGSGAAAAALGPDLDLEDFPNRKAMFGFQSRRLQGRRM